LIGATATVKEDDMKIPFAYDLSASAKRKIALPIIVGDQKLNEASSGWVHENGTSKMVLAYDGDGQDRIAGDAVVSTLAADKSLPGGLDRPRQIPFDVEIKDKSLGGSFRHEVGPMAIPATTAIKVITVPTVQLSAYQERLRQSLQATAGRLID
jgi:hypothetical protein